MADRLTDLQRKEIIAYYVECQNYSEVAKRYGIHKSTVMRIIKSEDATEMQQKATEKNEENTRSVLEAMEKRKDKKVKILDKILDAIEEKIDKIDMFTNIKDLATAYGIIMDKEIKIRELDIKGRDSKDALNKLDELLEAQKNA